MIRFSVKFLEEAMDFLAELDEKSRDKIIYNVRKAQIVADNEIFKKLTSDIWEFRTLYNGKYFRLFAFWDKTGLTDTIVVSTHGLVKKTDKTPKADLEKAERLRKLYFYLKNLKQ